MQQCTTGLLNGRQLFYIIYIYIYIYTHSTAYIKVHRSNTCTYCMYLNMQVFLAYMTHCKHSNNIYFAWPRLLIYTNMPILWAIYTQTKQVSLNNLIYEAICITIAQLKWIQVVYMPTFLKREWCQHIVDCVQKSMYYYQVSSAVLYMYRNIYS